MTEVAGKLQLDDRFHEADRMINNGLPGTDMIRTSKSQNQFSVSKVRITSETSLNLILKGMRSEVCRSGDGGPVGFDAPCELQTA
jgi:hypothetical protein